MRAFRVHAVLVGFGWVPLAAVAAVGLSGEGAFSLLLLPLGPALQGLVLTVAVLALLPMLWPVYLAIGWYEAALADRIGRGDRIAAGYAGRALRVQAIAATLGALGAIAAASSRLFGQGTLLSLTWVPFATVAACDWWVASRLPFVTRLTHVP
jgi:hypothetical protein